MPYLATLVGLVLVTLTLLDAFEVVLLPRPVRRRWRINRMFFEAAWAARMPVMLKGPTGCGKTRFVEHMAWKLGRPLVTVACNEDTTAGDLVGRWLLDERGTHWHDGPLTRAVRHGAICYLDEVVEARQDTTVVIHPLADSRRVLPLDRRDERKGAAGSGAVVVRDPERELDQRAGNLFDDALDRRRIDPFR